MSDFDPIKAMREELTGINEVHRLLMARTRESERKLGEAEAEHNALLKMEAFMKDLLATARAKLTALEEEAQR